MDGVLNLLNWLLPLAYLGLLLGYGIDFFLHAQASGRNWALLPVLVLHAGYWVLRGHALGHYVPVKGPEVMCILALATALIYTIIEYAGRERRTGLFVFLAVFLFQYTASLFMAPTAGAASAAGIAVPPGSDWARVHILPAVAAYVGFTLAAIYGLLFLIAQRSLKSHKVGVWFDRLPALDRLALMCWHAMLVGFAFVTVSLVSGATMQAGGEMNAHVLVRIIAGSAAWVIYAVAIVGRLIARWPASRFCRVAVFGFVFALAIMAAGILLS